MNRHILVAVAWPYASADIHVGNMPIFMSGTSLDLIYRQTFLLVFTVCRATGY